MNVESDRIKGVLGILTGDIRWLLEHKDCPSYPLILSIFASIEFIGKCVCRKKSHSDSATAFMDRYMPGYNDRLPDGRRLSVALYRNLRSAITHHGGARGGVQVSHEESAKPFHLKFCESDGKHFVVHSRSLAEDFLAGVEKALAELDCSRQSDKDHTSLTQRSMDQGYKTITCLTPPAPLGSPPFKGTDASGT